MKTKTLSVAILSIVLISTIFSAYSIREAQAEDINILIPKMHQNDPEWKDILMDNSETITIGEWGCTLTCWTMLINWALQDKGIHLKGSGGLIGPTMSYTPAEINDLLKKYRFKQAVDKQGKDVDSDDPTFDHYETRDGWNVPIDDKTDKHVAGRSETSINIGALLDAVEADTRSRSSNGFGLTCTNMTISGEGEMSDIGVIPPEGITLDKYGWVLAQLRLDMPVIVRTCDNRHSVIVNSYHSAQGGNPAYYDIMDPWMDPVTKTQIKRLDDPSYGNRIWKWGVYVFEEGGQPVPYTVPSPYWIDPEHLNDSVANPDQYGPQLIEPSFPFPSLTPDWSMFHQNPMHDGYSISTTPKINKTQWTYRTSSWVASSIAYVGGVVYVGSGDKKVYALNAANGTHMWNYTTEWPVYSSPAFYDNKLYIGSGNIYAEQWGGGFYCLDATSGTVIWNATMYNPIESSPAVYDGMVFVGSCDNNVWVFNATTGDRIWNYTTDGWVISSPAVYNGIVFVGSHDGNVYALNAYTGTLIWKYQTGGIVWSSPAVYDGIVYVGSNDKNVYALNAITGGLIWNYTTGDKVESSPAVYDGIVYVGSDDWNVYALNASTGQYIWKKATIGVVFSSVAIADGKVYVGSWNGDGNFGRARLYCLNVSNGDFIWSYETGSSTVDSSPAVGNGTVYIGASDCNVYAFGSPPPIPGDLDLDGKVGLADLVILAHVYGSKPGDINWNPNADIDGNLVVGLSDLVILALNYGKTG